MTFSHWFVVLVVSVALCLLHDLEKKARAKMGRGR
jgi:hypothetical protein